MMERSELEDDCAERKIEEKKSLLRKTEMGCFSTDFFRSCICSSVFFLRQLFLIHFAPVPHRIHDRVEAEAEFRQEYSTRGGTSA